MNNWLKSRAALFLIFGVVIVFTEYSCCVANFCSGCFGLLFLKQSLNCLQVASIKVNTSKILSVKVYFLSLLLLACGNGCVEAEIGYSTDGWVHS